MSAVVTAGAEYLEIEDLYVAPGHRSAGVGAQLVREIEHWAKVNHFRFLCAYSAMRDVDGVLRFYRAAGFESWSVQVFRDLGGTEDPPTEAG